MAQIIYFGNHHMFGHKRGIENVIDFQASTYEFARKYYIHFGETSSVYRWKDMICICISYKYFILKFVHMNLLVYRLSKGTTLLHVHNALMGFFLYKRIDLLTVHDGLYYSSKALGLKLLWLFKIVEMVTYLKSRKIHFISNFTKENSLAKDTRKNILIYNTSHLEARCAEYQESNEPNTNTLLIVRSIEERARIDLIVEAAQLLPQLNFVIAGKGPLLSFYKERSKNIPNIKLLGYVPDDQLCNLYQTCRLVIVPAEYGEGFGLPIIEGYLFGKPVVASNVCAIPEVIINSNFLFDNTVDSLREKINWSLNLQRMGYKAYYDAKFSNQVIFSQYHQLYHELACSFTP